MVELTVVLVAGRRNVQNPSVAALLQCGAPLTLYWHGKPLRNPPENMRSKRVPWRQKRAKYLPADDSAIGVGQLLQ